MKTFSKPFAGHSWIVIAVLATTLAVFSTACASSRTAGEVLDDAGITVAVKARLAADPEVNPFNIDVDTTEGVVRLSGTVDDTTTRREAVELARRTEGVKRVVNDLRVGEKTLGESIDDAAIVTKVNAALVADPELSALTIDVDSNQGVVTLSGSVQTSALRSKAETLARRCAGVKSVHNRLEVQPERT